MTFDETTVLLAFINGLDKRVAFDETSVSAWTNVLGPQIGLDEAMSYVREHYRETDRAVLPAHIVGRHRVAHTPASTPKPEPTHECLDGYVMIEEQTASGQTYMAAAPCPECTTSRHKSATIS